MLNNIYLNDMNYSFLGFSDKEHKAISKQPVFNQQSASSKRKLKAMDQMAQVLHPNLAQIFEKTICKVDFRNREVKAEGARATFSPDCTVFTKQIALWEQGSFIEVEIDNFNKKTSKKTVLELKHSRSIAKPVWGIELGVDLIVNGKTVVQGHVPPGASKNNLVPEQFDLTPFLTDGTNRIRIEVSRLHQDTYSLFELSLKTLY